MVARFVKLYYGWTTVNLLSTTDTYGTDTSAEFISEAAQLGIEIENSHSFWPGTTDFQEMIATIKKKGILKIFVFIMKSEDAGVMLEAGYNQGLFGVGTQIIGTQFVVKSSCWMSMSPTAPVTQIMKGVIGIVPELIDYKRPEYVSFIQRYLAQSDTMRTLIDGSTYCSTEKDDDEGTYLYLEDGISAVTAETCSGVEFSSLHSDDVPEKVAFAYDAVYTMALALHEVIYNQQKYSDFTAYDIRKAIMDKVVFTGVTGFIDIFKGLGGTEGYAAGDRESGLTYKALQFNPDFFNPEDPYSEKPVRNVGYFVNDELKPLACDVAIDPVCSPAIFNTKDGRMPDGKPDIVEVYLDQDVRNIILAGGVLSLFVIGLYLFAVLLFLDTRLIKASQPGIMLLVLFGATLGGVQVMLQTLDTSDETCMAGMWLGHMSFAFVFSALMAKTWKTGKIVNSGLRRIKMTYRQVLQFMSALLVVIILILIIDSVVGRPFKSYDEYFDGHKLIRLMKCENDNPSITKALFAFEGLMLLYGAKLCWDAKSAPDSVNDSGPISLAIIVMMFVCAVTFPIVFLQMEPTPRNLTVVMSSGFIFAIISVITIIFAPKTKLVLEGADVDQNLKIVHSPSTGRKFSQEHLTSVANVVLKKIKSRKRLVSLSTSRRGTPNSPNREVSSKKGDSKEEEKKGERAADEVRSFISNGNANSNGNSNGNGGIQTIAVHPASPKTLSVQTAPMSPGFSSVDSQQQMNDFKQTSN
eukprot:CAMPEP_0182439854 /NCGR_PEP_ID=MMETSP1167-20130531/86696_1 /TAXON_ID=2988 /ORGANISM="Mallomonas Sp, Strain CCMP3275" /LENGTH=749 /DNA_ID=CAMNT_0024633655 /DNA_START=685 /DNA_END=2934 /DNA_ORIENTATION=-